MRDFGRAWSSPMRKPLGQRTRTAMACSSIPRGKAVKPSRGRWPERYVPRLPAQAARFSQGVLHQRRPAQARRGGQVRRRDLQGGGDRAGARNGAAWCIMPRRARDCWNWISLPGAANPSSCTWRRIPALPDQQTYDWGRFVRPRIAVQDDSAPARQTVRLAGFARPETVLAAEGDVELTSPLTEARGKRPRFRPGAACRTP